MKIRTVKRTYVFVPHADESSMHPTYWKIEFSYLLILCKARRNRKILLSYLELIPTHANWALFPKSDSCDIEAGVRRPVGVSMGLWRQIWHRNFKHKINLCLIFTNPNFTFHSKWYRNLNIFISFLYLKDDGPQPPLLLSEQHLGSE